ncbi:MAG: hypothetical protein HOY71_01255 [Nonomuraea sp.]|nr:hypothetical protein [Nonomuraea sp.]
MTELTKAGTGGVVITIPSPLGGLLRRIRRHGVLLTALLLIAAAMAWKASIVQHAYFKEDDIEFVARAMESDLSFDYLTRVHVGQFMPGGFLLAWITTRLHPFDWGLAAGSTLALHALSALAVYRMLRVIFGNRAWTLLPLVVYLVAPSTVPVLVWWAAALNTVLLQLALPMAITAHWLYLRDGRLRHAVAAAAWVLFGLLAFVKGYALPLLLFALTAVYAGGIRASLRRYLPAWLLYLGTLLAFGVLYLARAAGAPPSGALPGFEQAMGFLWELLGRTFATQAVGGPWQWFAGNDWGVTSPPLPAVVLSLTLLALLVTVTCYYRRNAGWAWAILLGYVVVADALPVLWGRVHLLGSFAGTDTRYIADAAGVTALVVALALMPPEPEAEPYRRALPSRERLTGLLGAVFGAFVAASVISVTTFGTYLGADRRHRYLETARAELARTPANAVIYDRLVPGDVLPGTYQDYSRTSRVLGAMASPALRARMYAPPPALSGLVFDDEGRLRPVDVQGIPLVPRTANRCWPVVAGTAQVPLDNHATYPEGTLIRVAYAAQADTRVTFWMGDRATDVALKGGFGEVFLRAVPGADRIVAADLPRGLCIGDVTPGRAVPKP